MADDMTDKIKSILNNPEMMGMLSAFLGSKDESEAENNNESLVAINSVMDKIKNSDDKRINLLNALKPYMRNSRASNIDKAVKMLKITQLGSILKDL